MSSLRNSRRGSIAAPLILMALPFLFGVPSIISIILFPSSLSLFFLGAARKFLSGHQSPANTIKALSHHLDHWVYLLK